jgi:hypothetical protein
LEPLSNNPTPWLVFEPVAQVPAEVSQQESENKGVASPVVSLWPDDTHIQIIRATRSWIQYGTVGFAVICIVIGAVEALFGR